MTETQVVPALRPDLELSAEPQATGLQKVNIRDPVTNTSIDVRGFELSICRMISGRRTAGEVCSAAQAIGIPLTLTKLTALLRRLAALGLLAAHPPAAEPNRPDPPNPPSEPTPSAPVGAAMAAARHLTWSGRAAWTADTRAFYQHALKEARLDRLEDARRDVEALLAKAPLTEEAKVLLAWIEDQIAKKAAGQARETFADVFSSVEQEWGAEESIAEASSARRARRKQLPLAGGLLLALALLVIVPLPYRVTAHYRIEPVASEELLVQFAGKLGPVPVKEGQWVEADAVLARYEETGRDRAAALGTARQQLAQAEAAKKKAKKRDKAAAQRVAELSEHVKQLEHERLQQKAPEPVKAPFAGYVRGLAVQPGAVVEVGQTLCRLDAAKRLAVLLTAPVGVELDPQVTVKVPGGEVELQRDASKRTARGELDARAGLQAGAEGDVKVALGWRSFLRR